MDPEPQCEGGIVHDDGTPENGYSWAVDIVYDGIIVERFTPDEYPARITQVCIAWTQTGDDPTFNYDLVIYNDDGPDGGPGTLLASIPVTASGVPFWTAFAFYDYNVEALNLVVNSGSFYAGARWNPTDEQYFYILADESATTPLQNSYGYNDYLDLWAPIYDWFSLYRSMLIRAEVERAGEIPSLNAYGLTVLAGALAAGSLIFLLRRRRRS
jgi:hypothetical protein